MKLPFYMLTLGIWLLSCLPAVAQHADFPRDTSYNPQAALRQIQKKYPETSLVRPALPKGISAKTDWVYHQEGDRALHADVFYPHKRNKKGYPGVLMIHGGGWASGTRSHQVPMAQQLAARGYVTVAVEYRLSPEAVYPAGVYDLKTAVRWMKANARKFGLDTTRIASLGCSAGAQLAALLGTTNGITKFEGQEDYPGYSSDIHAVINIDGIVSFVHPEAAPEKSGGAAKRWLGPYESNTEKWKEASPLEYAGNGTPPFLFVNSSIPRFHAGRDDLIRILDSHGIYSEVHTLDNSPHSFWLVNPWFDPTLNLVADFLGKVFGK
ncbi:MAG: alpha/beta hydrolase [Bacteroidia bacterium]